MFVLPIIAGTFTLMSVFLSLPLLSLLSFQSIPTIDWCSFPPIAAYIGDLIDLAIGMGVSPSVTCCAVTSAGLGVIALLVFLSYYTTMVGVGRVGKASVLRSSSSSPSSSRVLRPAMPPPPATISELDDPLADLTLVDVDELTSKLSMDTSLSKIVLEAKPDLPDYNAPLHALSPATSMIDIPVNDTSTNSTISDLSPRNSTDLALPSHGSITTNLVDISSQLPDSCHYNEQHNPWLAPPEPVMDSEFADRVEQLIASIAALEVSSSSRKLLPSRVVSMDEVNSLIRDDTTREPVVEQTIPARGKQSTTETLSSEAQINDDIQATYVSNLTHAASSLSTLKTVQPPAGLQSNTPKQRVRVIQRGESSRLMKACMMAFQQARCGGRIEKKASLIIETPSGDVGVRGTAVSRRTQLTPILEVAAEGQEEEVSPSSLRKVGDLDVGSQDASQATPNERTSKLGILRHSETSVSSKPFDQPRPSVKSTPRTDPKPPSPSPDLGPKRPDDDRCLIHPTKPLVPTPNSALAPVSTPTTDKLPPSPESLHLMACDLGIPDIVEIAFNGFPDPFDRAVLAEEERGELDSASSGNSAVDSTVSPPSNEAATHPETVSVLGPGAGGGGEAGGSGFETSSTDSEYFSCASPPLPSSVPLARTSLTCDIPPPSNVIPAPQPAPAPPATTTTTTSDTNPRVSDTSSSDKFKSRYHWTLEQLERVLAANRSFRSRAAAQAPAQVQAGSRSSVVLRERSTSAGGANERKSDNRDLGSCARARAGTGSTIGSGISAKVSIKSDIYTSKGDNRIPATPPTSSPGFQHQIRGTERVSGGSNNDNISYRSGVSPMASRTTVSSMGSAARLDASSFRLQSRAPGAGSGSSTGSRFGPSIASNTPGRSHAHALRSDSAVASAAAENRPITNQHTQHRSGIPTQMASFVERRRQMSSVVVATTTAAVATSATAADIFSSVSGRVATSASGASPGSGTAKLGSGNRTPYSLNPSSADFPSTPRTRSLPQFGSSNLKSTLPNRLPAVFVTPKQHASENSGYSSTPGWVDLNSSRHQRASTYSPNVTPSLDRFNATTPARGGGGVNHSVENSAKNESVACIMKWGRGGGGQVGGGVGGTVFRNVENMSLGRGSGGSVANGSGNVVVLDSTTRSRSLQGVVPVMVRENGPQVPIPGVVQVKRSRFGG